MSGVFATCALSHLVAGMLTASDPRGVLFHNLAVLVSDPPTPVGWCTAYTAIPRVTGNRRPLVGPGPPAGPPFSLGRAGRLKLPGSQWSLPKPYLLRFDDCGLVPCVIQDWRSGEVLTLAYMNSRSTPAEPRDR